MEIPALRERLEDVPLLVKHFLEKQAAQTGTGLKKIDEKALELLCNYDYPGNVRELENAIERACALCDDNTITAGDLPPQVTEAGYEEAARRARGLKAVGKSLDEFIREQEREYIEATLAKFKGNREKAAGALGISRATFYRKLEIKGKK
ncbi:MAG: helix-turn-helix domain-containing protein [Chthoniobacterales bacterium]